MRNPNPSRVILALRQQRTKETIEKIANDPIKSIFGTRPNLGTRNPKMMVPRQENEFFNVILALKQQRTMGTIDFF